MHWGWTVQKLSATVIAMKKSAVLDCTNYRASFVIGLEIMYCTVLCIMRRLLYWVPIAQTHVFGLNRGN